MNFLANRYKRNLKTPMSQVGELKKYDDSIDLSLGDPDLNTDHRIIKAAFEDAENGHTHYTNPYGDEELILEIIKYYEKEHSCKIKKDEVFICAGAGHGLYLALLAVLNKGDEVIIHEPYYTPYMDQVRLSGGMPKVLETYEDEEFVINAVRLKKLITHDTKALILNYPNNPTGACISRESLEQIGELCIQKNILLISDEVYDAFSYDTKFIPAASIDRIRDMLITLGSFSKGFAMTGWRVGYIIAPSYIIECIKDINENICYTASSVSQRAAAHALRMRDELQPFIVDEYKKRVEYLYKRICSVPSLSCVKPKGAIYLFVNIKKTGLDSCKFTELLYKEEHVLVLPGTAFGDFDGYIRIAATVDLKKLEEAFDRIERFIGRM